MCKTNPFVYFQVVVFKHICSRMYHRSSSYSHVTTGLCKVVTIMQSDEFAYLFTRHPSIKSWAVSTASRASNRLWSRVGAALGKSRPAQLVAGSRQDEFCLLLAGHNPCHKGGQEIYKIL